MPGSFLEEIGAWAGMADAAAPILDIIVREAFSPIEVHYDHRTVGAEPLGHIVENRAIRRALIDLAQSLPSVELAAPAEAVSLDRSEARVDVVVSDGRRATAPLLALCEGRQSSTRERIGVAARQWSYGQTGIVCSLAHELAPWRPRGRALLPGRTVRSLAHGRKPLVDRLGARTMA